MAGKRQNRSDVAVVQMTYPPGTRLFCPKNQRAYQMGVKFGASEFWMFCEADGTKGKVDASVVLKDFEKVR